MSEPGASRTALGDRRDSEEACVVDQGGQPLADKPTKRGQPRVLKAATIAQVRVPEVESSESLIEDVINILGVEDEGWARALRSILPKQARAYMLAKVFVNEDSPHRSKKAMARMVAGLSTALQAMGEIGIEHTMVLKERKGKTLGTYAPVMLVGAPFYAVP